MRSTRVLVASDSTLLRDGIQALLPACPEVKVVGMTNAGDGAIEEAYRLRPAVLIVDIPRPDNNRLELLNRLKTELPELRVIVIGHQQDEASILRVLETGVRGYLCAREGAAELVAALQAIAGGDSYLCPAASGVLIREYRSMRLEQPVEVGSNDS